MWLPKQTGIKRTKSQQLAAGRIAHSKTQHLFAPSLPRKASHFNTLKHRMHNLLTEKNQKLLKNQNLIV